MNSLFNWRVSRPTLSRRLTLSLSVLTFSIITLFSGATLLITYSFEDVLFNERLKQAHIQILNGESLPYNISLVDDLGERAPDLVQQILFLELGRDKAQGEFSFAGKHYHYLVTKQGTIVYDTSDVTIIQRALEDILLILGALLIPSILLTLWVARLTARHALKPFNQLSQLFLTTDQANQLSEDKLHAIKEADVREIAQQLHDALQQKSQLLEQQMTFNQGMAHELRTPLQVMQNSLELMQQSQPELKSAPALLRLQKAINRMHRLSVGLLWITSGQTFEGRINTQTSIQAILTELQPLADAHSIAIQLHPEEELWLQMPEEVLELIVVNLFNNVISHGSHSDALSLWDINIRSNGLVFSNPYGDSAAAAQTQGHFGLGLPLVGKLSERFGYRVSTQSKQGQYVTQITLC
ncbi:HAMP domain-containing histidine kinase [Shewanella submarina]|uniref:histidine kinase n=1 Tax=Shewanella submarina TaxID=2016376 RepID=A0ABV7GIU8_9GAMM|nr:HAMP domain-containing sensor histidine kinase [Shewanella submarina]MCL1035884.1 HAMP domain-containing histidine kinase [Shewanella submarina]